MYVQLYDLCKHVLIAAINLYMLFIVIYASRL
jgi:hypothetical protein